MSSITPQGSRYAADTSERQDIADFVINFLQEQNFPSDKLNGLDQFSTSAFHHVCLFLLRCIDREYKGANPEDDLYYVLKFLQAPGVSTKSQFRNTNSSQTKNVLLFVFHWLVQLLMFDRLTIEYPTSSGILDMFSGTQFGCSRTPMLGGSGSAGRNNREDFELVENIFQFVQQGEQALNEIADSLVAQSRPTDPPLTYVDLDKVVAACLRVFRQGPGSTQQQVARECLVKFYQFGLFMMNKQADKERNIRRRMLEEVRGQLAETKRYEEKLDEVRQCYLAVTSDAQRAEDTVEKMKLDSETLGHQKLELQNRHLEKKREQAELEAQVAHLRSRIDKQEISSTDVERLNAAIKENMSKAQRCWENTRLAQQKIDQILVQLGKEGMQTNAGWKVFMDFAQDFKPCGPVQESLLADIHGQLCRMAGSQNGLDHATIARLLDAMDPHTWEMQLMQKGEHVTKSQVVDSLRRLQEYMAQGIAQLTSEAIPKAQTDLELAKKDKQRLTAEIKELNQKGTLLLDSKKKHIAELEEKIKAKQRDSSDAVQRAERSLNERKLALAEIQAQKENAMEELQQRRRQRIQMLEKLRNRLDSARLTVEEEFQKRQARRRQIVQYALPILAAAHRQTLDSILESLGSIPGVREQLASKAWVPWHSLSRASIKTSQETTTADDDADSTDGQPEPCLHKEGRSSPELENQENEGQQANALSPLTPVPQQPGIALKAGLEQVLNKSIWTTPVIAQKK